MESTTFTHIQHSKFMRFLANLVSILFHPLFMPTIVAVLLVYLNHENFIGVERKTIFQWIGVTAVNTILFPALSVLLLRALKFIDSIHMRTMKERILPLIATMVFYFWLYQVFKDFKAPFVLRVFYLGCFWGIIAVFIVNIFAKISMHTAAAGGVIGIMAVLLIIGQTNFLIPFLIVLLIAGAVGTARMILKEHTFVEIWLGYLAGILVQLGAFWFLSP